DEPDVRQPQQAGGGAEAPEEDRLQPGGLDQPGGEDVVGPQAADDARPGQELAQTACGHGVCLCGVQGSGGWSLEGYNPTRLPADEVLLSPLAASAGRPLPRGSGAPQCLSPSGDSPSSGQRSSPCRSSPRRPGTWRTTPCRKGRRSASASAARSSGAAPTWPWCRPASPPSSPRPSPAASGGTTSPPAGRWTRMAWSGRGGSSCRPTGSGRPSPGPAAWRWLTSPPTSSSWTSSCRSS